MGEAGVFFLVVVFALILLGGVFLATIHVGSIHSPHGAVKKYMLPPLDKNAE